MDVSLVYVLVIVILWLIVGLSTAWWMVRLGHDWKWLFVAVALGPLFVPAALERVEHRARLAASGPEAVPVRQAGDPGQPRVLVGLDGSPESERALTTALALLGPQRGMVVLAEVVPYEAADDDTREVLDAATRRLATAAARASARGITVHHEVLAGSPGAALRRFAEEQDMDLLVVGRRGRGLSRRLLGSVSADAVHHSPVPVLVVEPTPTPRDTTETDRTAPADRTTGEGPTRATEPPSDTSSPVS
ncbi:universal stress protein [Actinomycetospora cinnamomea]|uniref:Nucleotide-binding universal stress UspA family protein n=1 Tax=Actinomycetospora cinnamomea TaxID=663609 RepID=A0A2U1F2J8_9PSEU|nr:universal stress protein [Actinomycetospora cinnamomea]PVZ06407.1 nucleotide-binding universal stress UspA family protein [Actinomycetospora cinnamomea]